MVDYNRPANTILRKSQLNSHTKALIWSYCLWNKQHGYLANIDISDAYDEVSTEPDDKDGVYYQITVRNSLHAGYILSRPYIFS